jgi:hypothetical protein
MRKNGTPTMVAKLKLPHAIASLTALPPTSDLVDRRKMFGARYYPFLSLV